MAGLTHLDLYSIAGAMRRERKRYENRLARSDFVPEPGRVNMDEVNAKKYARLETFFEDLIKNLGLLGSAEQPPSYERFVEASLLDNWVFRYEVLAELDQLRAEVEKMYESKEDSP